MICQLKNRVFFIFLLCMSFVFPVILICQDIYSLTDEIPVDYKKHYENAEYRIHIYIKSTDCMSCLYILGKIDDKLDLSQNTFAALGLLDPRDTYSIDELNSDSDIKYPIIKPGNKYSTLIWDTLPTPLIMIFNRKNQIKAVIAIPMAISQREMIKITDSIFDMTVFKDYEQAIN